MNKLFTLIWISIVMGCAHGDCNNVPQRPDAATLVATSESGSAPDSAGGPSAPTGAATTVPAPTPTPTAQNPLPSDAVQVSFPTGEKQCGMEKPTPIDTIKSKLTRAKIKVYEAHTQADGLMHMDLCGSPTGSVHVFSISKKDFAKAKKLGFKPFKSASVN